MSPERMIREMSHTRTDLISVDETAAILHITPTYVRMLLRNGKLEGKRILGRWLGVTRASVEAVLNGGK